MPTRPPRHPYDDLPDVRDGLTRVERIVLWKLHELEKEKPGRFVSTAMLYGRVVEHVNISPEELQRILARLGGMSGAQAGVPRQDPEDDR